MSLKRPADPAASASPERTTENQAESVPAGRSQLRKKISAWIKPLRIFYFQQKDLEKILSIGTVIILIWVACVFSVIPWLFIVNVLHNEISDVAKDSQQILESALLGVWILFYGMVSAALAKRIEKSGLHEIRTFGVVTLGIVLIGVLNLPTTFVNSAMYAISLRENPQNARWYVVDGAVYKKLTPGSNRIEIHHLGLNNELYICAYSPFSYVNKKILCDPSVTKPNSKQCVVMNEAEARVIMPPQDISYPNIGTCPSTPTISAN